MKRLISVILALLVLVTMFGCAERGDAQDGENDKTANADDMFSKSELDSSYSEDDATIITFEGDKITLSDSSANADGSTVTLENEGTYILRGTLDDGCVVVDASKDAKLQLVLDGAHVTSSSTAAVFVRSADKVIFTLAQDSENSLANGGSFDEDEDGTDAALFAKDDIAFNGEGSLEIASPDGHGIVAKDDIAIVSGTYTISAASHGINANDSIRIRSASLNITSGKDALHAENKDDDALGFVYVADGDLELTSDGDGISASAYINIQDGVFDICAGGGAAAGEKKTNDDFGMFGGGGQQRPGGFGSGRTDSGQDNGQNGAQDGKQDGMLDNMGGVKPDDLPDGMGDFDPSDLPDGMGDFDPSDLPDDMGDFDPNDLPDGMGDFDPSDLPDDMGDFDPNDLPDGMGDFDPSDLPDGMGGNAPSEPNGETSQGGDDSTDSVSTKGIKAGGELSIASGEFRLDCADDCIHSNSSIAISGGTFTLSSADDGVHADESLTVNGCELEISESYEGLEALHIVIDGGKLNICSDDDGINAAGGTDSSGSTGGRFGGMSNSNGSIIINGGELYINASGDGIDANGSLEINGGDITVVGPTVGDTSTLDFDTTGVINGGSFFGTGSSVMAQSFTGGEQSFLYLKTRSSYSAGSEITVTDSEGNVIASQAPELDFNYIILSCDKLVSGETYTVSVDGDATECTAK